MTTTTTRPKTIDYQKIKIIRELKHNEYVIVEDENNDKLYLEDKHGNFIKNFRQSIKNLFASMGYLEKKEGGEKCIWVLTDKCDWIFKS